MRFFLRQFLLVCCAVYVGGAHWMVLQVTAWTGMIVTRAQTASVGEALRSTLDGAHPCNLCRVIQRVQAEEDEQQPKAVWTKSLGEAKLVLASRCGAPPSLFAGETVWPDYIAFPRLLTEEPPTPPPLA